MENPTGGSTSAPHPVEAALVRLKAGAHRTARDEADLAHKLKICDAMRRLCERDEPEQPQESSMNELSLQFENHEIRTVERNGEVWLVASDICEALAFGNYRQVLQRIDDDFKGVHKVDTLGGAQEMSVVNEQGVYQIAFRSNKLEARAFTKKVAQFLRDFREGKVKVRTTPTEQAMLPDHAERQIRIISSGMDLLDRLGGIDEDFRFRMKDQVKSLMASDKLLGQGGSEGKRAIWPISDRVTHLGLKASGKDLMAIGRMVAKRYREKHGRDPLKREQFVGGTTRLVASYGEDDLDIMDASIDSVLGVCK